MSQEIIKPGQDQPAHRICAECVDLFCFETTGQQGRIVRFIPEKLLMHDPQGIDSCNRKTVFKLHKGWQHE